jgi:CRP-like cAMP-binding protein
MVESVKIFAGCPRAFIQSLVFKLVPSICVLGDNIVTEGEFGDCLYFIRRGIAEVHALRSCFRMCSGLPPFKILTILRSCVLQVVVKGNIVVCKLHEGDYFGEIALIRCSICAQPHRRSPLSSIEVSYVCLCARTPQEREANCGCPRGHRLHAALSL